MVERTISVHKNLLASANNMRKLWHELLEIAGGKREQKPIAGPIRVTHALQTPLIRIGCRRVLVVTPIKSAHRLSIEQAPSRQSGLSILNHGHNVFHALELVHDPRSHCRQR